ncbi:MAG: hypothetical protein IJZ69_03785 [Bacteroidales bacterium]|nr:hypothetical protein [Bacteroidales bacterium]
METQDNMISLEDELFSFDRYFEANSRCVLSAPFGEGKSFFLNEFIKKKSSDYDFITLYPTGYQICDNKDVFEYIKRDILLALLALEPELLNAMDKTDAAIIWESISECREDIVSCLPEINIGVHGTAGVTISTANIVNAVCKVIEKCKKKWRFGGNHIKDYFNSFENNKGSLYEFNPISNMISSLIAARKKGSESSNPRKVVLVIEDLDRMDPEHILRILNVFSAHLGDDLDEDFSRNKFGFDKILLLCDYNNIKNIYHHLYGADADFKGYMSKFVAKGVFQYSLRSRVKEYMVSLLPRNLKENFPTIIGVVTDKIFDKNGSLRNENLRTIKTKFLEFKKSIIVDNFYFVQPNIGAFIKTDRIELINLWALSRMFNIDLSALLEQSAKQYSGHELYLLCWPFIIVKDNRLPTFQPIYYTENSMECLNGHRDFIVEHQDMEITNIRYDNHYRQIAESYLKEAYDFIKQCEIYIG